MPTIQDLLENRGYVITDGAMGTVLFAAGLEQGDPPELWNIKHPERVAAVHQAYLEAGSQVILTNTFGGSRLRLALHNAEQQVQAANKSAAEILRVVADQSGKDIIVAGDIGPTGEVLAPYGEMAFQDAKDAFNEQAAALIAGGVDVIWIETMSDLEEVRAAVEGTREVSRDIPIVTTMTFDTHGRTMMGVTPEQAFETLSGFVLLPWVETAATDLRRSSRLSPRCVPSTRVPFWSPRLMLVFLNSCRVRPSTAPALKRWLIMLSSPTRPARA